MTDLRCMGCGIYFHVRTLNNEFILNHQCKHDIIDRFSEQFNTIRGKCSA